MRLFVEDESKSVDVGTGSIWYCIYSTAELKISSEEKTRIPLALSFLKSGECAAVDANETAKQMNLVRDAFANIPPEEAVFDLHDVNRKAPWYGKISSVVTSCANLFTTSDGKDLFTEVVGLLSYAARKGLKVSAS